MVLKYEKKMYNISCMGFHIIGGKMKAAILLSNKIMTSASLVVILIAIVGLIPVYIAIGFLAGYVTARLVMKKFIGQLDNLGPMELPSSNFAFNMLVYALLFAVMGRLNVYALISSFVGLTAYRQMFFIFVKK